MYKVTFYQAGVNGIDSEYYRNRREACRAAADFIRQFGRVPGHRRVGSVYRDNYARLVDGCGATEACATVGLTTGAKSRDH